MLVIAGGIIIAVMALCALPFVIMALPYIIGIVVALVLLSLGIGYAASLGVDFTVFWLVVGFFSFPAFCAWTWGGGASFIEVTGWSPTPVNEFIGVALISIIVNAIFWGGVFLVIGAMWLSA